MPKDLEVKDILNPRLSTSRRIVKTHKELRDIISKVREEGLSIVLTQGVWDLIHEGHAKYLEKASKEGDILIVGVDSDELTQKRKGPRRPIVPEDERMRMISHLRCVHIVTPRNVKEPIGKLINTVKSINYNSPQYFWNPQFFWMMLSWLAVILACFRVFTTKKAKIATPSAAKAS